MPHHLSPGAGTTSTRNRWGMGPASPASQSPCFLLVALGCGSYLLLDPEGAHVYVCVLTVSWEDPPQGQRGACRERSEVAGLGSLPQSSGFWCFLRVSCTHSLPASHKPITDPPCQPHPPIAFSQPTWAASCSPSRGLVATVLKGEKEMVGTSGVAGVPGPGDTGSILLLWAHL